MFELAGVLIYETDEIASRASDLVFPDVRSYQATINGVG